MKLYLSSYKIGDNPERLEQMLPPGAKIGYIPNAFDFSDVDVVKRKEHMESDISELEMLKLKPEVLDLREYFGKTQQLQKKIDALAGLWVSGGNVFVLRQAMRLSGLDDILQQMDRDDFVYGGYSAAGCVLSPNLDAYQIVDDATDTPYDVKEVIWRGLGLIDFAFLPHFDSDHPESSDINEEVAFCVEHDIPYKTLRDGDVLVIGSDAE